jgi:pSer/pThr/pTyr-binding forkhead associated (FHA) protein
MLGRKEFVMASLIVISGPNEGDYYPLGQRTIVVGRQETCPVQVRDERASRKHLQVRFENGKHLALDMKSENGVWINNRRVSTETVLRDNDEIQVGDSRLVYLAGDFPDRESALGHYKQVGERSKPTLPQR